MYLPDLEIFHNFSSTIKQKVFVSIQVFVEVYTLRIFKLKGMEKSRNFSHEMMINLNFGAFKFKLLDFRNLIMLSVASYHGAIQILRNFERENDGIFENFLAFSVLNLFRNHVDVI